MATGLQASRKLSRLHLWTLSTASLPPAGSLHVSLKENQFLSPIITTHQFLLVKEYTGNDGNAVTGPLNVAAGVIDSGSHGLTLNDSNAHKQIITDAVNSGYLSATNQIDSDGIYVIMAGKDVQDKDFCHTNCGYNGYSDQFQYMFIGYPGTCPERYFIYWLDRSTVTDNTMPFIAVFLHLSTKLLPTTILLLMLQSPSFHTKFKISWPIHVKMHGLWMPMVPLLNWVISVLALVYQRMYGSAICSKQTTMQSTTLKLVIKSILYRPSLARTRSSACYHLIRWCLS